MTFPASPQPVVLLSQRTVRDAATGEDRDALSHDWGAFADAFCFLPVPVPNRLDHPEKLIDVLNPGALILTGGGDVGSDARSLESLRCSATAGPLSREQRRDRCEARLLRAAVDRGMPVLGVCRGMQFINALFGGRVRRDVSLPRGTHAAPGSSHAARWCAPVPTTGHTPSPLVTSVRSFHDHGMYAEDLARAFKPLALADDGVVEAIGHATLPILCVQWHPERQPDHPWNGAIVSFLTTSLTTPRARAQSVA